MEKDTKRHDELAEKIYDMGNALSKEGRQREDFLIEAAGNLITLVSGLLHDERDMHMFSELAAMFSAKKVLESPEMMNKLPDSDTLDQMIRGLRDQMNDEEDDE